MPHLSIADSGFFRIWPISGYAILDSLCNIKPFNSAAHSMSEKLNRGIVAAAALSLPEIVYRELRNAILNGVFAPGQTLRQEEVATRLGVSRSPLREALPRLEAEGIVVLNPRRGYSVATMRTEDIVEAFELRILLELELGRRALRNRTNAEIAKVFAILTRMGAMTDMGDEADISRWFELNTEFHQALFCCANCPQHQRALNGTRGAIESYVRAEVRLTGDLRRAQAEHSDMARAFAAGDEESFLRLIQLHSTHTRSRLLEGLVKSQS
ncbi:TPA: GntR family transcriptional regulator [Pseudomonas aeruginosa]